ncbi:unnamed protein product [Peniophora sp. CBMAI 1063]|nr:unnamed protein product [Peniophora sp. CBMAI 1063]
MILARKALPKASANRMTKMQLKRKDVEDRESGDDAAASQSSGSARSVDSDDFAFPLAVTNPDGSQSFRATKTLHKISTAHVHKKRERRHLVTGYSDPALKERSGYDRKFSSTGGFRAEDLHFMLGPDASAATLSQESKETAQAQVDDPPGIPSVSATVPVCSEAASPSLPNKEDSMDPANVTGSPASSLSSSSGVPAATDTHLPAQGSPSTGDPTGVPLDDQHTSSPTNETSTTSEAPSVHPGPSAAPHSPRGSSGLPPTEESPDDQHTPPPPNEPPAASEVTSVPPGSSAAHDPRGSPGILPPRQRVLLDKDARRPHPYAPPGSQRPMARRVEDEDGYPAAFMRSKLRNRQSQQRRPAHERTSTHHTKNDDPSLDADIGADADNGNEQVYDEPNHERDPAETTLTEVSTGPGVATSFNAASEDVFVSRQHRAEQIRQVPEERTGRESDAAVEPTRNTEDVAREGREEGLQRDAAESQGVAGDAARREREEREREEQERVEREPSEQERSELERIEQECAEQERIEQERVEQERIEQERAEQERVEQERVERERIEQERIEQERDERERVERMQREHDAEIARRIAAKEKEIADRIAAKEKDAEHQFQTQRRQFWDVVAQAHLQRGQPLPGRFTGVDTPGYDALSSQWRHLPLGSGVGVLSVNGKELDVFSYMGALIGPGGDLSNIPELDRWVDLLAFLGMQADQTRVLARMLMALLSPFAGYRPRRASELSQPEVRERRPPSEPSAATQPTQPSTAAQPSSGSRISSDNLGRRESTSPPRPSSPPAFNCDAPYAGQQAYRRLQQQHSPIHSPTPPPPPPPPRSPGRPQGHRHNQATKTPLSPHSPTPRRSSPPPAFATSRPRTDPAPTAQGQSPPPMAPQTASPRRRSSALRPSHAQPPQPTAQPKPPVVDVTESLTAPDSLHHFIALDERVRTAGVQLTRRDSLLLVTGDRERVKRAIELIQTVLKEFESFIPIKLPAVGEHWSAFDLKAALALYVRTRCIVTPLAGGIEILVQGRPQDFAAAISLITNMGKPATTQRPSSPDLRANLAPPIYRSPAPETHPMPTTANPMAQMHQGRSPPAQSRDPSSHPPPPPSPPRRPSRQPSPLPARSPRRPTRAPATPARSPQVNQLPHTPTAAPPRRDRTGGAAAAPRASRPTPAPTPASPHHGRTGGAATPKAARPTPMTRPPDNPGDLFDELQSEEGQASSASRDRPLSPEVQDQQDAAGRTSQANQPSPASTAAPSHRDRTGGAGTPNASRPTPMTRPPDNPGDLFDELQSEGQASPVSSHRPSSPEMREHRDVEMSEAEDESQPATDQPAGRDSDPASQSPPTARPSQPQATHASAPEFVTREEFDAFRAAFGSGARHNGRKQGDTVRRAILKAHKLSSPKPAAQPRGKDVNIKRADLRILVLRLLDRENNKVPFPSHKIPTAAEIAAFQSHQIGGPSKDNWRVDPRTRSGAPWNSRAGLVLTDILIGEGAIVVQERQTTLAWFKRYHDGTLRSHYVSINLGNDAARQANRDRSNRVQRHETLGNLRLTTASKHEELAPVGHVVGWAGPKSALHSDDEEDHLSTTPRYSIVEDVWKSRKTRRYLRSMDLLHIGDKFDEGGQHRTAPGNWLRERIPGHDIPSKSQNPLAGLPVNFYDKDWLAAQAPERRESLNLQLEVSLEFPFKLRIRAARVLGLLRETGPVSDWRTLRISDQELKLLDLYLDTGKRPPATYGQADM